MDKRTLSLFAALLLPALLLLLPVSGQTWRSSGGRGCRNLRPGFPKSVGL